MFRSLFPFRRLLAMSFLLIFANVLAGRCWCATGSGSKQAASGHSGCAAAKNFAKLTRADCHGPAPAAAQPSKAAHPTKHPKRPHDCCRDKSASLLTSLTGPADKHLLPLTPALLPATMEFRFPALAAGPGDRTAAGRLVPPQHLPPKIPDIRIFIQSLTV